jgi:hypothetical protein
MVEVENSERLKSFVIRKRMGIISALLADKQTVDYYT